MAILSDDFNRTSSQTVGGGWTEHESGGSANIGLTFAANMLNCGNGSSTASYDYAWCHQSHGAITLPVTLEFFIGGHTRSTATRIVGGIYGDGSTLENCVGVRLYPGVNGTHHILVNGTATNFTYNYSVSGTSRYIWVDYVANSSNVDIAVYISTTSTKPESATATLTNQAIPAQSNVHIGSDMTPTASYAGGTIDNLILDYTPTIVYPDKVTLNTSTQTETITGASLFIATSLTLISSLGTHITRGWAIIQATTISLTTTLHTGLNFFMEWLGLTKAITTFTAQSKSSTSFTAQSKNSSNWTEQNKS